MSNLVPIATPTTPGMVKVGTGMQVDSFGNLMGLGSGALRAPTSNDDTTAGYSVGDYWNVPGGQWWCKRNTAGKAVWIPVYNEALPLDAGNAPGAMAAYGMLRLLSSYGTGPCIDVQLTSGGTVTTINFLSSGKLDVGALEAALGGAIGYISKWYDQSGNAYHATQATFASMPAISISNQIGGARSVVFNAVIDSVGLTPTTIYLNLPAAVTASTQNMTVAMVGRVNSTARTGALFALGTGNSTSAMNVGTVVNSCEVSVTTSAATGSGSQFGSITPQLIMLTGTTNSYAMRVGNIKSTISFLLAATTPTGGYLGYQPYLAGSGNCELAVCVFYNAAQSATAGAAQDLLALSLNRLFGLTPQLKDVVAIIGDSQTQAAYASMNNPWARKAMSLLTVPANVYNISVTGETLNSMNGNLHYSVGCGVSTAKNNVMVIFGGSNDKTAGTADATVYGYLQTMCAYARTHGFNKVVVCTPAPRTGVTLSGYTALILANWNVPQASGGLGADAVIDFYNDPTLGTVSSTYYASDNTHWIDLGNSFAAQIAALQLNSVLQ